MILLMLILGVSVVFGSGCLAQSYGQSQDSRDFYTSMIGFAVGVFIFISMIGAL
jgi:hypothetical protein